MTDFYSIIFVLYVLGITEIAALNVTIVHTNDIHSRFVSYDNRMKPCEGNATCWGGAARRLTALKQIRANYSNVLLLDGGDQFQGTLWYTLLKWKPISEVVNAMRYDAMSFGNHEFDDSLYRVDPKLGEIGLTPYLKNVRSTFVSTNLDASDQSPLKGLFKNHHIITVDGEQIGVLGYITTETANISHPGKTLTFKDEIESLKEGVKRLQEQNINKIIAIGHAGIDVDKKICEQVKGIDVVVGGHTNTFLYSGTPPSKPDPEGTYPLVFPGEGDGKCLVVQDFAFGKYLGFLQVEFDNRGLVKSYNGNPILMDNRFEDDPEIDRILEPYKSLIEEYQKKVIGRTAVTLNGTRWVCRLRECNFGNLITDGMIYSYLQKKWQNPEMSAPGWATSAVAIANSASWRDIELEASTGITLADLFNTMVYANTVELIKLKGKHLQEALEHSVRDVEAAKDDPHGKFLQVSGLKVKYDLRKPNGQRVVSVQIKCAECSIPTYAPLDANQDYKVVTISFLKKGGDGYTMIKDNLLFSDGLETLDIDVLRDYIERHSPLTTGLEGRITYAHSPLTTAPGGRFTFDPTDADPANCPVDVASSVDSGVFLALTVFSMIFSLFTFV